MKPVAVTVKLPTMAGIASAIRTLKIVVAVDAPQACAMSMMPRGTSRRFCSTSRAKNGITAKDSATAAALGPMLVPTTKRENGIRITSRMMNGNERNTLTT